MDNRNFALEIPSDLVDKARELFTELRSRGLKLWTSGKGEFIHTIHSVDGKDTDRKIIYLEGYDNA